MVKKKRRVTLRDIAEAAGVTRMTVSLALRDKPGVSGETKAMIFAVAEDMGYQPDPEVAKLLARIRALGHQEIDAAMALLTSGPEPQGWKRSLTERKFMEGAIDQAKRYGYRVEKFWLNEPGMSAERMANIIWSRGIEGIILAPLQQELIDGARRSIEFPFHLFSVVEISETIVEPDLDRAVHDQYTSMQLLLTELRKLNYRRIGLVLDRALHIRVNGKWVAAFLEDRMCAGHGDYPPPLILEKRMQSAFDRWFDRYQPDVVVSLDHCGLRFLQTRGLDIPGEVGLASLDLDGEMDQRTDLSGIDQNSRKVGAAAVDMLVAAIQRDTRGLPSHPVRVQVQGRWRSGRTTIMQPAR